MTIHSFFKRKQKPVPDETYDAIIENLLFEKIEKAKAMHLAHGTKADFITDVKEILSKHNRMVDARRRFEKKFRDLKG